MVSAQVVIKIDQKQSPLYFLNVVYSWKVSSMVMYKGIALMAASRQ